MYVLACTATVSTLPRRIEAYHDALVAAGRDVAACYIHFAVTGGLVEVELSHAA